MLRKRVHFRSLDVPLGARNRALDYLANSGKYRLSDDLRYQLTQVDDRGQPSHNIASSMPTPDTPPTATASSPAQ
jgi:hypothetical protein